jgi:signal transduction histidine kinase
MVSFSYEGRCLKVCVRDNGSGFDQREIAVRKHGLGLGNIARRASLVGGEAFVESVLNTGTSVYVNIPYE